MTPTWTEDRIARLTEMWRAGLRARLIGAALGVSKNSVVGKAHRLRLLGRPSPIVRTGKGKAPAAPPPAIQRAPTLVLRPPEPEARTTPGRGGWHVSQAQSNAERRIREQNGHPLLPWAMTRSFLSVRGMRFHTCQWIEGQPSADDACKCGQPTQRGGPYCAAHHARRWRKRQRGEAA